ncbi:hypothetical protein C5167_046573 [Papaver somniferum]|uniref:non-specific serine/threonine protein kinase n=1 Tax=Papaver somniferum TaxID=3469 RepID=A0A4Y7LFS4_PAPSO|nr:hypothetical protein C5167_046573 [Papaver somniferum]
MVKYSILLLSLIPFFILGVDGEEKTDFDFGNLSLKSLKLLGDAHLNNGTVRLTQDLSVPNSGSGRLLYSKPIKFRKQQGTHQILTSFSTFFTFSVTNLNPSSVGAGLAFIISSDSQTTGKSGGFLGLEDDTSDDKGGFVGVEFDTLMDLQFEDVNGNHVGLDLNSLISAKVVDLDTVGIHLKSGNSVNSWIDYDGLARLLNVSVSYSNIRPKKPLFSFPVDLNRFVEDYMFVGFSASTQGSTEVHNIEWWSFNSSFDTFSESAVAPSSPAAGGNDAGNVTSSTAPSSSASVAPTSGGSVPSYKNPGNIGNSFLRTKSMQIAGVITIGVLFLIMVACLLIWVVTKRIKFREKAADSISLEIVKTPKEFSYKDLKSATNCFNSSRIIGHGAFGTVYKGVMPETGSMIAVKRCRHSGGQGKAEFLSELSIIGTLRHRNLVTLQGWCHEKGEILLVYDFMPNGSLDKALFEAKFPLPWPNRKRVLMGVASALAYLHGECESQVIHRDIKASNIMLDEFFNARVGDFGLAKQIEHDKSPDATIAAGTMGYLAPEYLLTGRATDKTDVFSYGAVVLEVITGRRPIEGDVSKIGGVGGSTSLVEFVWNLHREGRLLEAVDARIRSAFDEEEMLKVILIGLNCSNPDPVARPTMRCVVQMFLGEAQVPIVPKTKPSLCFSGVRPGATGMEHYESKMTYPISSPGVQFNETCDAFNSIAKNGLGLVNPEKILNFYNERHSNLASAGIDGVKVVQNILEIIGAGHCGRVKLSRRYHQALEASISGNFRDKLPMHMSSISFAHGTASMTTLPSTIPGFMSINCGGEEDSTDIIGLEWKSDNQFPFGERATISLPNELRKQYMSVRYFPADARKYCYTLNVKRKTRYLIRTTFLYGNFDNSNVYPTFDISLGATHWSTIVISDANTIEVRELIILANSPTISVCLYNATTGQPFISTIELRQFNGAIYYTHGQENGFFLAVSARINFGASSQHPIRYPDDPFDRLWASDSLQKPNYLINVAPGTKKVATNTPINVDRDERPPEKVMQTAVVGTTGSLTYRLNLDGFPGFGWAVFYLAEIEDLSPKDTRKFSLVVPGMPGVSKTTIDIQEIAKGKYQLYEKEFTNISLPLVFNFKFGKASGSTRGPLLNAMEINKHLKINPGSIDADWAKEGGDPCLPVPWSWLRCNSDPQPKIISITLSKKNLTGNIPLELTKLQGLVELWLDGNSLTGRIPDFTACPDLKIIHLENNLLTGEIPSSLTNLPKLEELYLQGNMLSGTIPSGLLLNQKLDFNYSGNHDLNKEGSNWHGLSIVIGVSVGVALLLLAVVIISFIRMKSKGKTTPKEPGP